MKFFINLNMKPKFTRPELLFHPPIPPAMHGLNPRTIMGQDEWDKVRLEVYDVNNDCCWACGVHRSVAKGKKWLEAHEMYDIDYKKGRVTLREIVALCHYCHNYIHRNRLRALVDARKSSFKKLTAVLLHGQDILRKNRVKPWFNMRKIEREMRNSKVKWEDWRLIWDGKAYGSRFKNELEWMLHYAGR